MLLAPVAVLAIFVLLAGAGFARERFSSLDPGMQRILDEQLYQNVGQSREADGVTITVTDAYADEGRTVWFYTVKMSPQMAARYSDALVGSWSLTDPRDSEPSAHAPAGGGVGTCSPVEAGNLRKCYIIEGPMHVAANTNRLTITLDIQKVYLNLPHGGYDTATGPWRFQFSIPFHHMNVGATEQFFPHLLHLAPGTQVP